MAVNNPIKIEGFDLTNEYAYRIILEGTFWGVYVDKRDYSIVFLKSTIHPNSVDRFSSNHKDGKSELYLHFNTDFGPRTKYIGETEAQEAASAWISQVNKLYEERRKKQANVEAAD